VSSPPAASSPTAAGSTGRAGPVAWVDALPIGPPPRVGYVIGHTYHSPDGGAVALRPDRGYTAIARLGDGFLVVDDRYFEGTAGILRLDARGDLVAELGTVAGPPVLRDGGRELRWITFTPEEVSPADRSPTRLHVADIATGTIRSRVLRNPGDLGDHRWFAPALTAPPTGERVARRAAPTPATRRMIWSTVWEDPEHVLAAVFTRSGRSVAVLRLEVSSGTWSLSVDWTPTERAASVAFEVTR
jgi:hypothetical protein